jgi:hypothetical protein
VRKQVAALAKERIIALTNETIAFFIFSIEGEVTMIDEVTSP